jgi:hypothetical protein
VTFKSKTQPLCRCCGKQIRKDTVLVHFKQEPSQYDYNSNRIQHAYVRDRLWPRTLKQAQTFVNQQIISISYNRPNEKRQHSEVSKVHVWDGESYVDPFFCSGSCASRFAYAIAKQTTYALNLYWEKQKKEAS